MKYLKLLTVAGVLDKHNDIINLFDVPSVSCSEEELTNTKLILSGILTFGFSYESPFEVYPEYLNFVSVLPNGKGVNLVTTDGGYITVEVDKHRASEVCQVYTVTAVSDDDETKMILINVKAHGLKDSIKFAFDWLYPR